MISFRELNADNEKALAVWLSEGREELFDEIFDIASSFSAAISEGVEVGFCRLEELLLVRIFDGEDYIFVYPIPLSDNADERAALEEIRLYAMREELPLIFCDVPRESLSFIEEHFRFSEAYAEDEDGESFRVHILTELSRAADIPCVTDGVLTLRPLCEEDIPDYAELSKDIELNKYWGYDYRSDNEEPDDEYFYKVACRALDDGVALSFAVDLDGDFVGEATLWGFDLLGSAELGFRILPRWQGRGFGARTLSLLFELGSELSLKSLRASVMKENLRSAAIVEKKMTLYKQSDNVNYYIQEIE